MKLFVANLSWGTKIDKLNEEFGPFGKILDSRLIVDRETGRSKGFGFITYETAEEGQKAISAMNGVELDGRNISVQEAQNKADRPKREGDYDRPRRFERGKENDK